MELTSSNAGFVSTASFAGAALVLVNFTVMGIIWYPFFKVYEKRMIEAEETEENRI